ncbi:helix-turn-helix domain-containing protein [uncultured Limimaricola sp.]|uniref:Crp/Fnr family transcriptional regulator n=1 Tax=uncultured Limimaricola sp. TaxID=2211667 RepID=UPI0030F812DA
MRDMLLQYVQSMMVQLSQSALAYGTATIEVRLARWLLMCHDRIGCDTLELTHEYLAMMMGVRRSGVSLALGKLEAVGLVRAMRGCVVIRNRAGLGRVAQDFYGVPEKHYRRLLGDAPAQG